MRSPPAPASAPKVDPQEIHRAKWLLERGDFGECVALCEAILSAAPGLPAVHSIAGVAALHSGQISSALSHLERAVELDPTDPQGFRNLCAAYHAGGDAQGACDALNRMDEQGHAKAPDHCRLGILLEALAHWIDAETSYRRASVLDPSLGEAHLGLGNALRHRGKLDEAYACFRRATEVSPNLLGAYNNLGNLLAELGDHAQAATVHEAACALSTEEPTPRYNLGVALQALHRPLDAARAFAEASKLAPADFRYRSNHALALQNAGELEAARVEIQTGLQLLERSPQISPELRGQFLARLVDVELSDHKPERALALCDRQLAYFPGDTSLLSLRAICLNDLGLDEEFGKLVDFPGVVQVLNLEAPPGWDSLEEFNHALVEQLLADPTLGYAPPEHATRAGLHSGNLLRQSEGATTALQPVIGSAVAALAPHLPQTLREAQPAQSVLYMWGVVMHSTGHQLPHIHPGAWLSGCYYPKVPSTIDENDSARSGWIEFGCPPDELHPARPMPTCAYPPRAGIVGIISELPISPDNSA